MNSVSNQEPLVKKPAGDLARQLAAAGFRPGIPPHLERWAAQVDAAIAAEEDCPICKAHGLTYRPHVSGRAYRVLLSCRTCGHTLEL